MLPTYQSPNLTLPFSLNLCKMKQTIPDFEKTTQRLSSPNATSQDFLDGCSEPEDTLAGANSRQYPKLCAAIQVEWDDVQQSFLVLYKLIEFHSKSLN